MTNKDLTPVRVTGCFFRNIRSDRRRQTLVQQPGIDTQGAFSPRVGMWSKRRFDHKVSEAVDLVGGFDA
jgi:hypothetical protein